MSTEKKVDVLDVLDAEIAMRNDQAIAFKASGDSISAKDHEEDRDALKSARDAVAELIDTCKYMSARSTTKEWNRFHDAIARVGGAP